MLATSPSNNNNNNHFPITMSRPIIQHRSSTSSTTTSSSSNTNNAAKKITRSNSILNSVSSSFLTPSNQQFPIKRCSFSPPPTILVNKEFETNTFNGPPIAGESLLDRRIRKGSLGASELPPMTFNDLPEHLDVNVMDSNSDEDESNSVELVSPKIIGNSAEVDLQLSLQQQQQSSSNPSSILNFSTTPGGTLKRNHLNKTYLSSAKRVPTPFPEKKTWIGEDEEGANEEEANEEDDEEGEEEEEVDEDEHPNKRTSIHSLANTKN